MVRKMLLMLGLLCLTFASVAPSQAAAVTVSAADESDADSWEGVDASLAGAGDAAGQELISASIDASGDTVNFIIGLKSLPGGGTPEITRYTWNFTVNDAALALDGKYTNYSRGTCDPTSGTCPPPRDPGATPFFLRGNCTTTGNVSTCQELALLHATFDEASATITIAVPLAKLTAASCAVIGPGTNIIGGSVSASVSAFVTSANFPHDAMEIDKTASVGSC